MIWTFTLQSFFVPARRAWVESEFKYEHLKEEQHDFQHTAIITTEDPSCQADHPFFLKSVYEVYLNGSYLNLEQNYYK